MQPCEQTEGFRNWIVHEYTEVGTEIVWAIVQNEVPRLLEKSESILEEEP